MILRCIGSIFLFFDNEFGRFFTLTGIKGTLNCVVRHIRKEEKGIKVLVSVPVLV